MLKLRNAVIASTVALVFAGFAHGQTSAGNTATPEPTDGEVRKVDKDSKKLTLKHGPLKNLDMPGMTMVFQVKDDAMLDKVQAGDKVRFQAEKIDGKITITTIEAAR